MRIKFDLPKKDPDFCTDIQIRVNDLNYGAHLGNDSVLTLCHEARVRLFQHWQQSEKDLFGARIIMADAAIMYKGEGFLGDILKCSLFITDVSNFGFDLYYGLKSKVSGREVARVKTGIVFYDYEKRSMAKTPKLFMDKFGPN